MIYDCFMFNDELDLLELRLEYMSKSVDFFVLVESARTLTGLGKPLHYKENIDRFKNYDDKIIYIEAPKMPDLINWDYEYFQRNCILKGLENCQDDDIILISDVDEIINVSKLLKEIKDPAKSYIIPVANYYYFLNLRSNTKFYVNLITNFGTIKKKNIGNRVTYKEFSGNELVDSGDTFGWHFSYLYGFELERYQKKIESFSHQEHNTAHKKDPKRIFKTILFGNDLFGRTDLKYKFTGLDDIRELWPSIKKVNLDRYFHKLTPKLFLIKQKILIAGYFHMIKYRLSKS